MAYWRVYADGEAFGSGELPIGKWVSIQAWMNEGHGTASGFGFHEGPTDIYITQAGKPGSVIAVGRAERRKQQRRDRIMAKKTKPKKC